MLNRKTSLAAVLALGLSAGASSGPVFAEGGANSNEFWWPEKLNLEPLRQHGAESNPMGDDFNYAEAFASLDLDAVKKDIANLMTTS